MKKLLVVLVVLACFTVGAFATSNQFTITAQVNSSIAIALSGTWAVGAKDASSTATMVLTNGIAVTNTSTVACSIVASVANSGSWVADSSAAENKYVLKLAAYKTANIPASDGALATALGSASAVAGSANLELGALDLSNGSVFAQLQLPSKSTSAASQTITVTVTAGAL